jgi:hypothetical protein
MKNEEKEMLLELSKKQIIDFTETLNHEMSKIQMNISKEDFEKLSELSIKINNKIDQLKALILSN